MANIETLVKVNKKLQQGTFGKPGRDLFSHCKDLTIVLAPFERFSTLSRTIDRLFKVIDIPFNLIVVEEHAPDHVRAELEKQQKKHGNILVIYSLFRPTIYGAFNLALPHINTPYALFMDNGIRFEKNTISMLLKHAKISGKGMVCPTNSLIHRFVRIQDENGFKTERELTTLGIHHCFLMSAEAIQTINKFDETLNSLMGGIDLVLLARKKGIEIGVGEDAYIEHDAETGLPPLDTELCRAEWSANCMKTSMQHLNQKWGISFIQEPYKAWIEAKRQAIASREKLPFWYFFAAKRTAY